MDSLRNAAFSRFSRVFPPTLSYGENRGGKGTKGREEGGKEKRKEKEREDSVPENS